ncbi:Gag-Pol polyprotein [Plecturocebus cupreus]
MNLSQLLEIAQKVFNNRDTSEAKQEKRVTKAEPRATLKIGGIPVSFLVNTGAAHSVLTQLLGPLSKCPYPLLGQNLLHKLQANISFDESQACFSIPPPLASGPPQQILIICALSDEYLLQEALSSEAGQPPTSDLLCQFQENVPGLRQNSQGLASESLYLSHGPAIGNGNSSPGTTISHEPGNQMGNCSTYNQTPKRGDPYYLLKARHKGLSACTGLKGGKQTSGSKSKTIVILPYSSKSNTTITVSCISRMHSFTSHLSLLASPYLLLNGLTPILESRGNPLGQDCLMGSKSPLLCLMRHLAKILLPSELSSPSIPYSNIEYQPGTGTQPSPSGTANTHSHHKTPSSRISWGGRVLQAMDFGIRRDSQAPVCLNWRKSALDLDRDRATGF